MKISKNITIIICTYNRATLLAETLPLIINQCESHSNINILTVNNNSTDSTINILSDYSNKHTFFSFINEPNQGLSYARNSGFKATDSEWIVYLDDDALVSDSFVVELEKAIDSNNFDCFGGIYFPWYKYGKPKWFKDIYASTADYYVKTNTHKIKYASGGIMAIKRSLLVKYNGFDVMLGMNGDAMAYGEETYLQRLIEKDGYRIGIIPEWHMNHIVNKYKLKPSWYIHNGYVSGRDAIQIYSEKSTVKAILKYTINTLLLTVSNVIKNTPKLLDNNYYWQNWIIETFRPVSVQFGQVIGNINNFSLK